MKGKEVYKIWAPSNNKWTSWVRPVPFVAIDYNFKIYQSDNFQISKIEDVKDLGNNSAIIIVESCKEVTCYDHQIVHSAAE